MSELLERVRARCIEIGDCWEWQGAMQSCGATPTMRVGGNVIGVRRLLLQQAGVDVEGKTCTYKCGNKLCVNPDHLQAIGRSKLSRRNAKEMKHSLNVLRRARLAERARAHSKLTRQLVEEIRAAEGRQADIAARYGVSQSLVSAIKRNAKWRDYNSPFAQLIGEIKR